VTIAVPASHRHRPGVFIEVCEGTDDIIAAYREVGSYRGPPCAAGVAGHLENCRLDCRVIERDQSFADPARLPCGSSAVFCPLQIGGL
jgi:hypothetical protein